MPTIARTFAILLVVLTATACSTNRKPRFDVDEEGSAVAFRRYTGRPAVDYTFRWSSKAFRKVEGEFDIVASKDATDALNRHGKPQYIRTDVGAEGNEIFDEWVYWDQDTLLQFIDGELVFEGPLLDSDKILIRKGYPSNAWSQQYEAGPRREFWVYQDLFEVGSETYSFSDGKLIFQSMN